MKRIIILGIVVVGVVALWSGGWLFVAGQASNYVKNLETADGVTTPRVSCGNLSTGGFPFGLDLTCTDARIVSGDTTIGVSGVKASVEIDNPTHVLVSVLSPVQFSDAFTGSSSRLDFTSAEMSARLSGWRIGRVSLVVERPTWSDNVLEDRLIAQASHVEAHLIDIPDQHDAGAGLASLAPYVEIDGLSAPGLAIVAGKSVFQGQISKLPDDVRTYGDGELLQRWAKAGGIFRIDSFTGADGDNWFDVAGTLGLDDQGRAQGQLKLSSKGIVERVGDVIPPDFRGLILGAQAPDGSYRQTLNIAGGVVLSGLMPTAVIPPLF